MGGNQFKLRWAKDCERVGLDASETVYLMAFRGADAYELSAKKYSQFQIGESSFSEICSECHRENKAFTVIVRVCCICGKELCTDCGVEILYQRYWGMSCLEHVPEPWRHRIWNYKDTNREDRWVGFLNRDSLIPKEATQHFKRQCEYKRLEVLCGLIKEGDRVLDVGCGIGTYTSNPLACLPISITAIDYDSKSIEYAREHNGRKNLEFVVASAEYYESEEKFDVIVCSHILEHTNTPMLLLANMRRLLKDEGMLYLGVPNGYGSFEVQNLVPRMLCEVAWGRGLVHRMMRVKDTLNTDSPHIQFFTIGSIRRLLKWGGWRIVKQVNDEFLGGIVFDRLLPKFLSVARWNVAVADSLPAQLANGWIFVCKKDNL